jgi:hypothetical protein
MNNNRNFNINFVVFSQFPEHVDYIGSSAVSHILARNLALQGESTFIYANKTIHDSVTCIPWNSSIEYDNENTIFIVPAGAGEHTFKNDIPNFIDKADNVVRHLINKQVAYYPATNKLYPIADYFGTLPNQYIDGYLTIFDVDFDLFKNNNLPRSGRCFLIKGNEYIDGRPLYHTSSDTNIDDYWKYGPDKMKYLAEVFNRHEIFFTYNTQTFICVLAALCGCKTIVIPHPTGGGAHAPELATKENFLKTPIFKSGIAYGFEDIQHSIDTLHNVKNNLQDCLENNNRQMQKFIDNCYIWLQDKYKI